MSKVQFCPHCGSGLATSGRFCGSCGNPLSAEPPTSEKKSIGKQIEQALNTDFEDAFRQPKPGETEPAHPRLRNHKERHGPPAKKGFSTQTGILVLVLGMIGIGIIGLYLVRGFDTSQLAAIEMNCFQTGTGILQCTSRNNGSGAGTMCFEVILVCDDGHHRAPGCTPDLGPGESNSHVVDGFEPPVSGDADCPGIEYDKLVLK